MEIIRQKEMVEAFHYDYHQETDSETEIRVEIKPIDMSEEPNFKHDRDSVLGLRVVFKVVFEKFALTGAVNQLVTVLHRTIKTADELEPAELDELMKPLFSMIERLTYEVTEIALDQPGIQLNFQNENQ